MQCAYHPDREPIGACVACGKLICMECKAVLGGKIYCSPCADKIFVKENEQQQYQPVSPSTIAINSQSELIKPSNKKKSRSRKRWAIAIFIIIIVILIILAVIAFISTGYSIDISI